MNTHVQVHCLSICLSVRYTLTHNHCLVYSFIYLLTSMSGALAFKSLFSSSMHTSMYVYAVRISL